MNRNAISHFNLLRPTDAYVRHLISLPLIQIIGFSVLQIISDCKSVSWKKTLVTFESEYEAFYPNKCKMVERQLGLRLNILRQFQIDKSVHNLHQSEPNKWYIYIYIMRRVHISFSYKCEHKCYTVENLTEIWKNHGHIQGPVSK